MKLACFLSVAAVSLVACGGGEPAETGQGGAGGGAPAAAPAAAAPAMPSGPMTTPDWFHVDAGARRVHMVIIAGATPDNNHWNFNGATRGSLAITVPEGHTVEIEFTNRDPNMAHSLGVSTETANFSVPPTPTPVFAGAISQNPGSMIDGTMPGETETITFVAERAGNYSFVCYIPGHTAVGMWIHFNISSGGEVGVQTR
jgi:FtsP/CotA-like multicopper oxidase with cupredoxin domain